MKMQIPNKQPMHGQFSRIPQYAILAAVLLVLAACALNPPAVRNVPAGTLFFPPPPNIPRVQHLAWITGTQDLPVRQNRFSEFVFGSEPQRLQLIKPISAILVGSNLYICDTVRNTVLVYDLAKGGARTMSGDFGNGKIKQPNSISVDDAGSFYVADRERGAVLVYGPDEKFLHAWGRPGEVQPVAVAADADRLYICDMKDHEIEVWNREDGSYVRSIGALGGGEVQFFRPTHITIDRQGMLYITDNGNFRVQKITPDGKFLQQFGKLGNALGHFAMPKGIATDLHGRLYAVDARFPNIQIFNSAGKLLLYFGGRGSQEATLDLPAGIQCLPWPNLPWLNEKVAPEFNPESLLIVVDQSNVGPKIHFFAIAADREDSQ